MKTGTIGEGNIGSALAGHLGELRQVELIANSRRAEARSQIANNAEVTPLAWTRGSRGTGLHLGLASLRA